MLIVSTRKHFDPSNKINSLKIQQVIVKDLIKVRQTNNNKNKTKTKKNGGAGLTLPVLDLVLIVMYRPLRFQKWKN